MKISGNVNMKTQDAIKLAVENVLKDGLTDVEVFASPFELQMIKGELQEKIIQSIKESLKQNSIKSLNH